jgi:rRNA maturation endonuclease Nob1
MAQFNKQVCQWCQTCHRRFVTGTLIGADRRKIGDYCNQCGERAKRKAEKAEQRQAAMVQ